MSIVRINDEDIDTDFIDTDTCSHCEEQYVVEDGCICQEDDQDWDYRRAIRI